MARLNKLRLVALAMMISGFVYAGILFSIEQSGDGAGDLWVMMFAVAGMTTIASFAVPRLLPAEGSGESALERAVSGFFTRTIVALVMSEAVILNGFAAAFVAQEPLGVLPFLVAGELLMVIHFPRIARFEAGLDGQALIEWGQEGDAR